MVKALFFPSFLAGILTFLAPCTFPLLPAYISFIGGTSVDELKKAGSSGLRRKVFINGIFYVAGFSLVFILLGSLFGLGGSALASYRDFLSMVGGVLIIFFGLYLAGAIKLSALNYQKDLRGRFSIKPGTHLHAMMFGATFALGWTPCVGPVLGAVLTLAASYATVGQGALLLFVFSLGLAIPFLLLAALGGWAFSYLQKVNRYLHIISMVGGILLIILGLLLITGEYQNALSRFYQFNGVGFEKLMKYY